MQLRLVIEMWFSDTIKCSSPLTVMQDTWNGVQMTASVYRGTAIYLFRLIKKLSCVSVVKALLFHSANLGLIPLLPSYMSRWCHTPENSQFTRENIQSFINDKVHDMKRPNMALYVF